MTLSEMGLEIAGYLESFKTSDPVAKSALLLAAREIQRLEEERSFWYKTGYHAGQEDHKAIS